MRQRTDGSRCPSGLVPNFPTIESAYCRYCSRACRQTGRRDSIRREGHGPEEHQWPAPEARGLPTVPDSKTEKDRRGQTAYHHAPTEECTSLAGASPPPSSCLDHHAPAKHVPPLPLTSLRLLHALLCSPNTRRSASPRQPQGSLYAARPIMTPSIRPASVPIGA